MASDFLKYDPAVKAEVSKIQSSGQVAASAGKEVSVKGDTNLPAAKQFGTIDKNIKSLLAELGNVAAKDANDATAAFEAFEKTDKTNAQSYEN